MWEDNISGTHSYDQLQRAGEIEGAGGLLSQAKLARHDRSRAEKEAMCIKENS
jgi:hypothetical protein